MSSPAERPPEEATEEQAASPSTVRSDGAPSPAPTDRYLDFEIEIANGEARSYPLTVTSSPAGEARETMLFPFDDLALESRLKSLRLALLRSGGPRRHVLSPEEDDVRSFGRSLFDALLVGRIHRLYETSYQRARDAGKGLRLKLRIQPPELACLPWEYIYDPDRAEYVSLSRDTPIVRYVEVGRPIEPLLVEPPLRILGMIAGPSDLPPLDVARERQRVDRALEHLQAAGVMQLTWLEGQTWRELQSAMRHGPWHVFHFVGHGDFDRSLGQGIVVLTDDSGRAHRLSATELGRLLADHHPLRLVILNSCEGARGNDRDLFSSTAAILVRRGLPAVLAMQDEITDRAAVEFSRAFYEALADGYPVDAAVAEARKAVSLAVTNTLEWGTPVLYMRAPRGVIFEMPERRAQRPTPSGTWADDDRRARVDALYTDALGAFWVEDWDRACARLENVLELEPSHADARERLATAERARRLAGLRATAHDALEVGDWVAAVAALERIVDEAPNDGDAAAQLHDARRRAHCAELASEAARLHEAGRWAAVMNVVAQIHEVDPGFDDVDDLSLDAARELAEEAEHQRLEELYRKALRELDQKQWSAARALLADIETVDAGFRDTSGLIRRCEEELKRTQAQRALQSTPAPAPTVAPEASAESSTVTTPPAGGDRKRRRMTRRGFDAAIGVVLLLAAGIVTVALLQRGGGDGTWIDDDFDGTSLDESTWRTAGNGQIDIEDGRLTFSEVGPTSPGSYVERSIVTAERFPFDEAMYAEARVLLDETSPSNSSVFVELGNESARHHVMLDRFVNTRDQPRFRAFLGDGVWQNLGSVPSVEQAQWHTARLEYFPPEEAGGESAVTYLLDGEVRASWRGDMGTEPLRLELTTGNSSTAVAASAHVSEVRVGPVD